MKTNCSEESLMLVQKVASQVPGVVYQFRLRPDGTSCFPFASEGIKNIYRVSPEDVKECAKKIFEIIHPEDSDHVSLSIQKSAKDLSKWEEEYRVQFKDGTIRWLLGSSVPELEADGSILWHGFITDITDRKKAEESLRIAAISFDSQDGIMVTDSNNIILRVNKAFEKITGYTQEHLVGTTPRVLHSGRQNNDFYIDMWKRIKESGYWEGEIFNRRKDGEIYPEHLTITAVKDNFNKITNYVATHSDITISKAAADEIRQLAFYDPLTSLPNRRLLMDRLEHALATSNRNGERGALLFLDLDRFKNLNDSLGHHMGDLLLKQVAKRLSACVRECDTVARLGGDEFVVLLEGLSSCEIDAATQTKIIGSKILESLNQPYLLGNIEYLSSSSIGSTLFNGHDTALDTLLKQADIAMYESKAAGRNALRFFDPIMQESINSRISIEAELHRAISQEQFELYYQVQIDQNGIIFGAEALIRWQHPTKGIISPIDFIHLAEETGLILPIGHWVLDCACDQLKEWEKHEYTKNIILAVNVSSKQFSQPGFVDQVKATIQYHDINPALLKIELTESMLIKDVNDIIKKMDELNKIGINFSLDDFGTGYSSLQYLKRLHLDQLKIDKSFVEDISSDESDRSIVKTIINMAHSLGLNVIAEGVETEDQKQFLKDNGCNLYQGYLFSAPVPIEEFNSLCKGYS